MGCKVNIYPLLNIFKIEYYSRNRMEYYYYKKHNQIPAMKENGKTNSVNLFFIHTVLLTLVVYWLCSLGKIKYVLIDKLLTNERILVLDVTIGGSELF